MGWIRCCSTWTARAFSRLRSACATGREPGAAYRRWLVDGRGLSQATVVRRLSRRDRRAHGHHRASSHGLGCVFAVSVNGRVPTPRNRSGSTRCPPCSAHGHGRTTPPATAVNAVEPTPAARAPVGAASHPGQRRRITPACFEACGSDDKCSAAGQSLDNSVLVHWHCRASRFHSKPDTYHSVYDTRSR